MWWNLLVPGEPEHAPIASTTSTPRDARRHVLMLIDHLVGGGAERFALELAMQLPADRFRRTLCVTRMPADYRSAPAASSLALGVRELQAAGVALLPLARRSRLAVWDWAPLLRTLRGVDVVHAHMFTSNCWGSVLGRAAGVPVVIGQETTWSFRGGAVRKALDRHLVGRLADRVVTVSELDRTRMAELEGVPAAKLALIRNAVLPREVTGHDLRQELGIPAGAPVLVALAMLRRQKALGVLVQALAIVRERFPDAVVLVAGGPLDDNPEADRLRRLIGELGLEPAVHLLGRRDDVGDVLAAADVGVLSSDYEGTPLAVLEYMQAGLPVVATAVGGVPEFVVDGVTGRLVPPRDPAALAGAVVQLLDDPERRRGMGERGRDRQQAEFTFDAVVDRFVALYDELLAAAPARR
jgi:glycosyltransferase involved in cell wall biosynthesis